MEVGRGLGWGRTRTGWFRARRGKGWWRRLPTQHPGPESPTTESPRATRSCRNALAGAASNSPTERLGIYMGKVTNVPLP